MSDSHCAPLEIEPSRLENGSNMYKIGQVAKAVGISLPTLRMYEREGLLIPWKTRKGTRFYSDRDLRWIQCIRRMVSDFGLNLEGIRRLLALIPCWQLSHCVEERKAKCQAMRNSKVPCWMVPDSHCQPEPGKCYECNAYRYAVECENLKQLFQVRIREM